MSRSLIAALLAILGLTAFGLYERHVGAVHAQAVLALQADSVRQDSTLRAYRTQRTADSALLTQNRARIASEARLASQEGHRGDSLETALRGDTGKYVLRDSAVTVVAARDSQIAHLTLVNLALTEESAVLLRGISARDSTIASLDAQLTTERHATANALQASQPGFLGSVSGYVVKGLAIYGLIRLVRG